MTHQNIERVAVFSSGGDAPGMNAAIRAIVRTGLSMGIPMYGISRGYQGMIDDDMRPLTSRSVSNIIQQGGTILKAARCPAFQTEGGMEQAYRNLKKHRIDAFVAVGGDGTFRGADEFCKRYNDIRCIGIPGTIDNDIAGTDMTLGFDTALNTVIESIDRIRDTAASHDRCFFIEVMGRDSGCLALHAGIAGGAEAILLPEVETDIRALVNLLEEGKARNKMSSIIIVGEGEKNGGATEVARKVKELLPHYDTKVTILGHVQRGGSPTAYDRILGGRLGVWAMEALLSGSNRVMAGIFRGESVFIPFEQAVRNQSPLDMELMRMNRILSS